LKVSYLGVACATKGDYTKKPAAAKELAAMSSFPKIAQETDTLGDKVADYFHEDAESVVSTANLLLVAGLVVPSVPNS